MKILTVKVKPNSRKQEIRQEEDGSLTVYLKSPPIAGKANQELIQLLAKMFDVPQSYVQIKAGVSAKSKRVEIHMD